MNYKVYYLIFLIFSSLFASISISDLTLFNGKSYSPNSYKPYSGDVIDYYENSHFVKVQGKYLNGVKNGEFIFYYDNGIINKKGNFSDNKKVGAWLEFDKRGILLNKRIYNDNNFMFYSYYENLKIAIEGEYINNKKEGIWIDYDERENKIKETFYKNGIADTNNIKFFDSVLDTQMIDSEIDFSIIKESDVELKSSQIDSVNEVLNGEYLDFFKSGRIYRKRFYDNGILDTLKKTLQYYESGSIFSEYDEIEKDNQIILNGQYIAYFENGNKQYEGQYKDGFKINHWLEYYDTGEIYSKKIYKNDFIPVNYYYKDGSLMIESVLSIKGENFNGSYKKFYPNGALMEEGKYIEDIKDALWLTYFENGNISSKINFIDQAGMYYSYYKSGEILQEGYFVNGKKHGMWTQYYLSGNKKNEIEYLDGDVNINNPLIKYKEDESVLSSQFVKIIDEKIVNDGLYIEFFETGIVKKRGIYTNNTKSGNWFEYYDDGSIFSEIFYDNGSGLFKSYYPSKKLLLKGKYKNNERDGKWTKYFENGNKSWEYHYLSGELNPNELCYHWYESGYKRSEGYLIFIDDQILWDGKYIEFFENGVIFLEGEYIKGNKNGLWKEFYSNRTIRSEKLFKNGVPNGEWLFYNEYGKVVKIENY